MCDYKQADLSESRFRIIEITGISTNHGVLALGASASVTG